MKFILLDNHLQYSDAKRFVSDYCSPVFIGMGDDDYELFIDLIFQNEEKLSLPSFICKDIIKINKLFYIDKVGDKHIHALTFFIKLCDIHLLPDELCTIILLNLDRIFPDKIKR